MLRPIPFQMTILSSQSIPGPVVDLISKLRYPVTNILSFHFVVPGSPVTSHFVIAQDIHYVSRPAHQDRVTTSQLRQPWTCFGQFRGCWGQDWALATRNGSCATRIWSTSVETRPGRAQRNLVESSPSSGELVPTLASTSPHMRSSSSQLWPESLQDWFDPIPNLVKLPPDWDRTPERPSLRTSGNSKVYPHWSTSYRRSRN